MKIDYAIVSCDDNPLYYNFWNIVQKLWTNLIGIKPILVKISDTDNIEVTDDYIIHNFKKIEGIDTGFQSQVARMYVTKFYPEDVCLTSDIDMLPLSKKYFVDNIKELNNDSLVIFSADAYPNVQRYPICYNAAKGKVFHEIMNFENTFEEYCLKLKDFNWGWDTDELYFGQKVDNFINQNIIIKLNRGWEFGRAIDRIDRVKWSYNPTKLKSGKYIDSHSLRPYILYKNEIDKLVNYLF
jgi:hypothetical protein